MDANMLPAVPQLSEPPPLPQQQKQSQGKQSFTITVDAEGKIQVNPQQEQKLDNVHRSLQLNDNAHKQKQVGKQRIRIAIIEEAGSSDDEPDTAADKSDIISIDAQSLEALTHTGGLPRFVKIYNKDKPSFVVLEDALVRKRIEEAACHCHAQQQTTPNDFGAHTGSQTDELLLPKGHNSSSQTIKQPRLNRLRAISKRSLSLPAMCCYRQMQQSPITSASVQTKSDVAPHVSISVMSPTPATISVPQYRQQAQQQQQQEQFVSVLQNTSPWQTLTPGTTVMSATATNCSCCLKPQLIPRQQQQLLLQQQQQQQPQQLGLPAYGNCCSSCCMLRPVMAQTSIGCCQCNSPMLLTPEQQQNFPYAGWPSAAINPCCYYPTYGPYNMSSYDLPQCACCQMPMLHQQQQQQCKLCGNSYNFKQSPQQRAFDSYQLNKLQPTEPPVRHDRTRKHHSSMQISKPKPQQQQPEPQFQLESSGSQLAVKEKITKKLTLQEARPKAGASVGVSASSKLYLARFGRTCLILKPTAATRIGTTAKLLTKRICRYTSMMAWPSHKKRTELKL
ncbi:uncharacterized protein LOC108600310 [Drosophila busckii]|uniref:uncharacterized protein LOC108600310 n=1 Tax=Drosophila busckii TaxID=30019 RepID=UPI00083EB68E|nr:uncharacterized protein LOC108600310 [Drosophila busckii]